MSQSNNLKKSKPVHGCVIPKISHKSLSELLSYEGHLMLSDFLREYENFTGLKNLRWSLTREQIREKAGLKRAMIKTGPYIVHVPTFKKFRKKSLKLMSQPVEFETFSELLEKGNGIYSFKDAMALLGPPDCIGGARWVRRQWRADGKPKDQGIEKDEHFGHLFVVMPTFARTYSVLAGPHDH